MHNHVCHHDEKEKKLWHASYHNDQFAQLHWKLKKPINLKESQGDGQGMTACNCGIYTCFNIILMQNRKGWFIGSITGKQGSFIGRGMGKLGRVIGMGIGNTAGSFVGVMRKQGWLIGMGMGRLGWFIGMGMGS